MGQQLADNPFEGLDILAVAAGLAAAYQGDEPEVSDEQIGAAFQVISQRMQQQQQEQLQQQQMEVRRHLHFLYEELQKKQQPPQEQPLQEQPLQGQPQQEQPQQDTEKPSEEDMIET